MRQIRNQKSRKRSNSAIPCGGNTRPVGARVVGMGGEGLYGRPPSLRGEYPSRRGEGGWDGRGGPLWSPAVPLKDGDQLNSAFLSRRKQHNGRPSGNSNF